MTCKERLWALGARKFKQGFFPSGKPKLLGELKCVECEKLHWVAVENTYRKTFTQKCRPCASKVRKIKHGLHKHPLYVVWAQMKHRCVSMSGDWWKYYGSRGITVCEAWKEFLPFYEWAIVGWLPGLLLDRKENDKGYSPENCRWLTSQKSAVNRSTTKLSEGQVAQIRARWRAGEMQKNIAADFGIARNHVSNIVNFDCWKPE